MHIHRRFNFDYSYLSLPEKFYSLVKPYPHPAAEIFLLNEKLCHQLNIPTQNPKDFLALFFDEKYHANIQSFAQAYAGHQFGYFTNLGDGRAIVIGEHITDNQKRFDIQLKGGGRTPYARRGDGKATLVAMLREYLISEAMHHLNIPSSRSLAVIKTGEPVYRPSPNEGAVLVRAMTSHIRVGTFQYAAHFGSIHDLKALATYTLKRLYPEIEQDENPAISLLKKVMTAQIDLVVHWMRVGFVHGVMNTDNTSISGETFDYGPCAFMNSYHPDTCFSSIDENGRYAFGNQPQIIKWNIARLAESLLPIIHPDREKAIQLAQSVLDEFDGCWQKSYYETMLRKIGIGSNHPAGYVLVDELLHLMQKCNMDYTNTFLNLSQEICVANTLTDKSEFKPWLEKWKHTLWESWGTARALQLMKTNNPAFIPRNHWAEKALNEAVNGNMILYEKLLSIVSQPYQYQEHLKEFAEPPDSNFDSTYQTFCGT